jgi:hypothetical protein
MTHNQVRNNEPRLGYHFDGGASTHLRHTLHSMYKRFVVQKIRFEIVCQYLRRRERRWAQTTRLRVRGEKSRPVRPTRRLELYKLVTQCWPPCNISPHRPPTHPYYYYHHHRGHPFHQGKAESRGVVVYETRYAGGRNAGRRRSCTNVTRE